MDGKFHQPFGFFATATVAQHGCQAGGFVKLTRDQWVAGAEPRTLEAVS